MSLVEEITEAKTEFARATYALAEYRERNSGKVAVGARREGGAILRELEASVATAKARLEQTERDVLERARAILAERDPDYAKRIAEAHLVPEAERSTLIGAADRLTSEQ